MAHTAQNFEFYLVLSRSRNFGSASESWGRKEFFVLENERHTRLTGAAM